MNPRAEAKAKVKSYRKIEALAKRDRCRFGVNTNGSWARKEYFGGWFENGKNYFSSI